MKKSLWLKNVIVRCLKNNDNPMYVFFEHLKKELSFSECSMYFFNTDSTLNFVLNIKDDYINDLFDYDTEAILNLYKQWKNKPDYLFAYKNNFCLSLKTDKTSMFGFVEVKNSHENINENITDVQKNAIDNFSFIVYSEALGGIIESFNPVCISTKNLCVDYSSGEQTVHAVKNVNLDINEGEFTIILGTSGCGKTSMLNTIGGMIKPTSGSIIYQGNDVAKYKLRECSKYRREIIGFIFQNYNLIHSLNAVDNIEVASALAKDPINTEKVLKMVGMEEKGKRFPWQMSGGEQQRICIARALVKKSNILLCDEPTGALDSQNSIQVLKILQALVENYKIAVVMITHNPAFSVLANHCITMSNGKIINEVRQPFVIPVDRLDLR